MSKIDHLGRPLRTQKSPQKAVQVYISENDFAHLVTVFCMVIIQNARRPRAPGSAVTANFLRRQFAKRTAFLRKREEKKVLQAKPPIVSTLFQSFLDTQRVNLRRVLAKPMKSISDKRSRPAAGPVLGWFGSTRQQCCRPCSTVRSSATGSNRATMKTPVRPLDPCRRRSTQ